MHEKQRRLRIAAPASGEMNVEQIEILPSARSHAKNTLTQVQECTGWMYKALVMLPPPSTDARIYIYNPVLLNITMVKY